MSLERGADVKARDKYGKILQSAERGGHGKVVCLLLRNGADFPEPTITYIDLEASLGVHGRITA